jgi:alkylation response protein AidB-like acyl-CoA dehydrogenase
LDLDFDDQQQILREATRKFLAKEAPVASVRQFLEGPTSFDRTSWKKGAQLGWTSVLVPEARGGLGGTLIDLIVFAEEFGRTVHPGPLLPTNLLALAISEWGGEHQSLLPQLLSGEHTAAWCVAETEGVWDASGVGLTAKPTRTGFELNGGKTYVENAQAADYLLITALSGSSIANFVVPARTHGIEIENLKTLDLTRRFGTVTFSNVQVPASALIGDATVGRLLVERLFQTAIVLTCADALGGAERLLEMTVAYALDRRTFGRSIATYQAIKHKCADMLSWLESSKVATYYAALAVQNGRPDARRAVSIAKSYVGDACSKLAGESLQIHGGIGFTWEHDLHLYLRRAKTDQVLFGDPFWHREVLGGLLEN